MRRPFLRQEGRFDDWPASHSHFFDDCGGYFDDDGRASSGVKVRLNCRLTDVG